MKRSEAIELIKQVLFEEHLNPAGEVLFQLEKAGMFPPHHNDDRVKDVYGRYEVNFTWENE